VRPSGHDRDRAELGAIGGFIIVVCSSSGSMIARSSATSWVARARSREPWQVGGIVSLCGFEYLHEPRWNLTRRLKTPCSDQPNAAAKLHRMS
jgi:hypothetical protein